jgi:hypothetical protein
VRGILILTHRVCPLVGEKPPAKGTPPINVVIEAFAVTAVPTDRGGKCRRGVRALRRCVYRVLIPEIVKRAWEVLSKSERTRANLEAKLFKAQKTTDEAKTVVEAERDATRAKTARLKAERLAKEVMESGPKK